MSGVIGIDAASGGWVVARISRDGQWELDFIESRYDSKTDEVYLPSSLVEYMVTNRLSLIDMPVGLVSRDAVVDGSLSPEMAVHREDAIRRLLRERVPNGGRFSNSVFPTPVSEAVYASDYESGAAVNKEALGKSISRQTWNLVYRIKQVQAILQVVPGIVGTLLESHPETVYRLLHAGSGAEASLASKRTQEGIEQRLNLLEQVLPGAQAAFDDAWHHWGKDVRAQRDDAADAMVLALCAYAGQQQGKLYTPVVMDGSLREASLPLQDFTASRLGSGIHSRRRDVLLKAEFPAAIPRGSEEIPLCMVYCPPEFCNVSR
ncbi:DUF429 domain-containing protein [Spirochaeta africana]|uniref:DUF429 domain-containing protein n=1 Tax=Spirochaeta africana (strain ATCC 700263 / DSM 8902 / Z-7692) TaxID=889378 RepID=H9UH55_SPIAZ|nr:DUF429 domain-containing protein [Spirochaeta africana]AFG36848.1 hypothetical protein Spiaf_0753 [Spirochaeta africana DSM 8902]